MSYPPPLYRGDQGEASSTHRPAGAPASMLLHFAPGAPREGYFEGLLELAGLSEQEREDFYRRHDNLWL